MSYLGKKIKPQLWTYANKYSFERSIMIPFLLRATLQLGKQKSPIANHATTLCKECEIQSLTTQALSQLWITQSLLFPGRPFSLRVENGLSFLERLLRSSWESNEHFLLSARAISRPVICQVSMAGKHSIASILVNGNHTMLKMFVYHPRLTNGYSFDRLRGNTDQYFWLFLREILLW